MTCVYSMKFEQKVCSNIDFACDYCEPSFNLAYSPMSREQLWLNGVFSFDYSTQAWEPPLVQLSQALVPDRSDSLWYLVLASQKTVIWAKRVTNAIKTILHSSVRSSLPQAHPLNSLFSTPCPKPPSKDFYFLCHYYMIYFWEWWTMDDIFILRTAQPFVLRFTMNILIILSSTK